VVKSKADSPEAYLAGLSPERREAVARVREVVLENLPNGYEEGMEFGMISYHIPLERYPETYNGRPLGVAALASQKNHVSLYLLGVGYDPEAERWFEERFRASGKKLRMGKSCVRFKRPEDLPLDVIGEAIARVTPDDLIGRYEASRAG
jgi:hypothetical protein